MTEPLAFDGEELSSKIPALGVAEDVVTGGITSHDKGIQQIGVLWPGGRSDSFTDTFATNYLQYGQANGDFMVQLSRAVGGQKGNLGQAAAAHTAGEDTNVMLSKKW